MKEIFDFIDTTKINTLDALQLKCMIEDVRSKAIEEFAERMYRKVADSGINQYKDSVTDMIDEIAEQLKANTKR